MDRLTTKEFIKRAKEVHGDKYEYFKTEYINARTKVCIICSEHGEFWQRPADHLNGCGCFKCRKSKEHSTTEEFIKKAKLVHGDKYDYSKVEYTDARTKVCIICPEHGEFWMTPNAHLCGRGCPVCSNINLRKTLRKSKEEFVEKAREIHGDRYDYSKVNYLTNKTKVCIICPEHGEFWMTPNAHFNGQHCPMCNFSRLEFEMCNILDSLKVEYVKQKRFEWLGKQSLDFYLPELKLAIECQGNQHFIPVNKFGGFTQLLKQVELDKNKHILCESNGIDLIYFTHFKKISNYFGTVLKNKKEVISFFQNRIKQK